MRDTDPMAHLGEPGALPRPGPFNALTDVAGIRVGQVTRTEPGWRTGVTVIVPPVGTVGGVDVRGGAPGTRETDLLDPRALVDAVDAVVLAGGSAFGLAAADGVVAAAYADGRGWPVGGPDERVPIVPAAILFDLGRGGHWLHHPGPEDGRRAFEAAQSGRVEQGWVGAGTGAMAGGLRGGIGTASVLLDTSTGPVTVAALVACNAVGSPVKARSGVLYAVEHGLAGEFGTLPGTDPVRLTAYLQARMRQVPRPGTATTIAVVATDATLSKALCHKLAGVAHDGMARAISPVHTAFDGDTVFALATGSRPAPTVLDQLLLHEAVAGCVTRAIGHALIPGWRETLGPAQPAT